MITFPTLTVFLLCVSYSFSQNIRVDKFHHGSVCNVQERLRLNCSEEVPGVRSFLHCHTKCLRLEACNRVSVGSNGTCYLHKDCPYPFECNGADERHQHLERHCLHGTWNTTTQSCDCPEIYSGDRCQIHPYTCIKETYDEKRYFIDPDKNGENLIPVTCSGTLGHIILLRNNGQFSFNRTWEEYKRGFYMDEFHHWIGLDNWHRLSSAGCKEVRHRINFGLSKSYKNYVKFILLNDSTNFLLSNFQVDHDFGKNTGGWRVPKCFSGLKQTPFSTWDRDNDGDPGENCAARAGSGWWYLPGCVSDCNVLGLGAQFWNSTPPEQHLKLKDGDLATWMQQESLHDIFLKECKPSPT